MGAESRNDSGLSETEICLLSGRATVDVAAPSPEWSGVEFMSSTESDRTHMARHDLPFWCKKCDV